MFKKPKLQSSSSAKEDPNVSQTLRQSDLPSLDAVVADLTVKLNVQDNVADLVLVSMAFLPEQMTPVFQSTYKPISAAGTTQQIKHLAKMLAVYLNESGVLQFSSGLNQPDSSKIVVTIDDLDNDDDMDNDDNDFGDENHKSMIKVEKIDPFDDSMSDSKIKLQPMTLGTPVLVKPSVNQLPANLSKKSSSNKGFKLGEITSKNSSQFNTQSLEELFNKTYNRILESEGLIFNFFKYLILFFY